MKCITINNHDYATRAYGEPTANDALHTRMRTQDGQIRPRQQFPRMQYSTDGRTQVVRYA